MTTAIEVIRAALGQLGADSDLNPAPPETYNRGVEVLSDIIIEWDQQDFRIQALPPTDTADDLQEALGVKPALESELAMRMAVELQIAPTQELVNQYGQRLRHAQDVYRNTLPDRRKRAFIRGRGNVNPWR